MEGVGHAPKLRVADERHLTGIRLGLRVWGLGFRV